MMDKRVKALKEYLPKYRNAPSGDDAVIWRDVIENLLLDELDRADAAERKCAALKERTRWRKPDELPNQSGWYPTWLHSVLGRYHADSYFDGKKWYLYGNVVLDYWAMPLPEPPEDA